MTQLAGTNVLVTGGAGTIGSTLVDQLLEAGVARVDVLDNLVRGRLANLEPALASGRVNLVEGDIRDAKLVDELTAGKDVVFHQAAIRRCAGARRDLEHRRRGRRKAQGKEACLGVERVGVRHG